VGVFSEATNTSYKNQNLAQFQNTLDTELFQNSRMSASSLRYYGIGLENGNYTVKLQFAETAFPNPPPYKWEDLGRRIFDIYMQVPSFFTFIQMLSNCKVLYYVLPVHTELQSVY
jgi:Malectin domain